MKLNIGPLLAVGLLAITAFKPTADYGHQLANGDNPSLKQERRNKALKIMVISDLNDRYGSVTYSNEVAATIRKIGDIKPDIVVCGGDMVAGQKASLTEAQLDAMWDGFNRNVLKPIDSLKIPFAFTMGNHDASPNYLKDRHAAKRFWDSHVASTNLTFVDRTHYPFYFSYLKNNVFFISWDASSAAIQPEVLDWMQGQLQSKLARESRLRILLGHLPLYAIVADKNKAGEVIGDADRTLEFFRKHGVDVYISGHQHAYFPAHKNGVQLFNSGCLGGGPRSILGHHDGPKKAYAIIEIPVKSPRQFVFNGYMPETDSLIGLHSLPESVQGFNGSVNRIDIPY